MYIFGREQMDGLAGGRPEGEVFLVQSRHEEVEAGSKCVYVLSSMTHDISRAWK